VTETAPLVGIFAAGRNGSTLLMRLLDGSPGLWVHPVEISYLSVFSDLARYGRIRPATAQNATRAKPLELSASVPAEKLIAAMRHHDEELRRSYLPNLVDTFAPRSDPLAELRRDPAYRASTFLPRFIDAMRRAFGNGGAAARRWDVFKSIETPYLDEYAHVFPDMRFVHIVREPIENYASLKRTNMVSKGWPFWRHGGDELRMFLETRWIPHARTILRARESGDARHFLIRYEELTADPVDAIARLAAWLGVPPPADPTQQTVLGGREMTVLPANPSKPGVATPQRVVRNVGEAFGYEDVVTARERDLIVQRTYPWARRLGYVASGSPRSGPERLRLLARWALPDRWELRNARDPLRLARALLARRAYICGALMLPGSAK
jgi:hypothetical protein